MQSDEQPYTNDYGDRPERIRAQLARILASSGFAQSPRMRRFLGFVVECSLNGETNRLKESTIGVEVFDRAPSYDPKTEPIVRTEAHRLREKLREYYEREGINDRIVISVPKGGYAPHMEVKAAPQRHLEVISFTAAEQIKRPPHPSPSPRLLWWVIAVLFIGAAITLGMRFNHEPPRASSLTPLTSLPGNAFRPRFSPDGQRVAFVWDGGTGNFDIFVKLVNAGDPLRLTSSEAQDLDPAWSPDGRQIAFIRRSPGKQELYTVPSMGGAERKIAEISAGQSRWGVDGAGYVRSLGPAWLPGGEQIAVTNAAPGEPDSIYLIGVETGAMRRLTAPENAGQADSEPVFSPKGDQVAFVRVRAGAGGAPDIWVQPVAGEHKPRQVTFDGRQLAGMTWTADGRRIIFSSGRDGEQKLWQIPAAGGSPSLVPGLGTRVYHPSLSSDGRRLAFAEEFYASNIWRAPLRQSDAPPPAPFVFSTRRDESPQYSADGRRIVFISNRSGPARIWTCDADGRNAGPLPSSRSIQPGTPRWSPDGKQILFDSRHEGFAGIYVISSDGGSPRLLSPEKNSSMMASWSNDGRAVFYSSDQSGAWQIWRQPLSGGPPSLMTRLGGKEAKESPDGKILFFTKSNSGKQGQLWEVPLEAGGEETPVPGLETVNLGRQWVLSNSGVYYISQAADPPTVLYFDFAKRTSTRIMDLGHKPVFGSSGPTISPDGLWILYSQVDREASNVMLLENFQ